MYLKRKVYDQLVKWKKSNDHSTLEINGARQVGKTYLITKFAKENFSNVIYINLFELSGKQFMVTWGAYMNQSFAIPAEMSPA